MGTMKTPVITIDREYGAGGRTLAALLSERLQIPYYDRDVVSKTVEESGIDEEDVEREGEELSRPSEIFDHLLNGTVPYSSSHDRIYEAEKKVILELAKDPCIIVGRCANSILKESGVDSISIYLHAPFEKKLKRAKELNENGDMKPEKFMEKRDEQRRTFYKHYTGGEIFDAANYTFCFDTGKVSIPFCADMIISLLQKNED
ncbi:MAG: cytidylate kinase-like family protein [Lachnospiraceae bacterium]|nr:cytidylate kinase-like family protein [Lachnospiraceae bacterium]